MTVVSGSVNVGGVSYPATANITLPTAGGSNFLFGVNTGIGATFLHGNPDLTSWKTCYQEVGPGATGSNNGKPFATVTKLFDAGNGYPNFPSTWGGMAASLSANNGGVPLVPLLVFDNTPTVSQIVGYLKSLPAGQRVFFNYQSEQEGGITASAFQSGWVAFSQNLNSALAQMGNSAFYNRNNFQFISASLLSYYQTGGDTQFIPPLAHTDGYGADFYQHFSATAKENVGAAKDPRYQNWLKQVYKVAGPNPVLWFTEYGLGMATYSAAFELQRQTILQADFEYMTGPNAPGKLGGWMYWWQMDAGINLYPFPLANGTETWQQASGTIKQFQNIIAAAA